MAGLAALSACGVKSQTIHGQREIVQQQPEEPKYEAIPQQKIEWIAIDGGQLEKFKPAVDVLFVIDNSDSMKSAQEKLSANIEQFANRISGKRQIDFHFGVISVWDSSERFKTQKKDPYGLGELRFIRNGEGQKLKSRFVTRFQGMNEILAATLKIGVAPLKDGGPEVEEIFAPLSEALKKTGRGDTNEDFFRPEANLAVVVITDADEGSPAKDPEQMAQELFDFKNGQREKVSVYGALVSKSDDDKLKDYGLRVHKDYHPECFDKKGRRFVRNDLCKEGFGPERLEKFIVAANPESGTPAEIRAKHIMSLTQDNFGKDLAKLGSDIAKKTLAHDVQLTERPRQDKNGRLMIRVRYGTPKELAAGLGQLIPQKRAGGWLYDAQNNVIRLAGDIDYDEKPEGRFLVEIVPLNITR